ncbi:MAG: M20/M25/M40 family metallo-hydrolase [Flavobacteriaceae bacterium]|nr:M20/M25/M40 family metallo-hydrolase [Flavobacteriaceae bacterium]
MKSTFSSLVSLILLAWAAWFSISYQLPKEDEKLRDSYGFEMEKALDWVESLSKEPRYVGSSFHNQAKYTIQNYLSELGIENHTQSAFVSNKRGNLTLAQNIVAKIEGKNPDQSTLLIMAHYDSAMIHSHGASDNLVGVAVILETIRALKEKDFQPENDLVFLFSDAEEIGLLGAQLFVDEHPWAKKVDFTINFEARGTSGPSNMIIETNHGNQNIIQEFIHSNPSFPVANSLMYSVYKMLPNDTDSTVFRENLDVPGLFFAFIDDHQNYHTSLDNFQNLDPKSLLHQAYYLNESIYHFAQVDLKQMQGEKDLLYFNFPILGMLSFSLTTALIVVIFSFLLCVAFAYYGVKKNMITAKLLLLSSLRLILFLIVSGLSIFFIWYFTKQIIPHYHDYIHGFTHHAHVYIAFCFSFVIGLGFLFYRTPSNKYSNLYASFPAYIIWLFILLLSLVFFPGLAYVSLPFGLLLIAHFLLYFNQTQKSILKLVFSLPMFMVMVPLLQNLVIGLGLEAMYLVAVLTALMFASLLPVIGFYPFKKSFGYFAFCVALFYWGNGFVNKGGNTNTPYFSSLNYSINLDTKNAQWVSYNAFLTPWLSPFFDKKNQQETKANTKNRVQNKQQNQAPFFSFELSEVTHLGTNKFYLKPHEKTSRIQLMSPNYNDIIQLFVNGKAIKKDKFNTEYLMRYYVVHQEPIEIELVTKSNTEVVLKVQETRFNLYEDERLNLRQRPRNEIAMPFVTTDAIFINYTVDLDEN